MTFYFITIIKLHTCTCIMVATQKTGYTCACHMQTVTAFQLVKSLNSAKEHNLP